MPRHAYLRMVSASLAVYLVLAGAFYTKDCAIHGFAMFNSTAEEQHAAALDINAWAAEGKLKAPIDRVLPLSKAAEAHRLQEESTVNKKSILSGKIVLNP